MSDTMLFMIGVGVFGVALIGAMWSIIPADTDEAGSPPPTSPVDLASASARTVTSSNSRSV